MAEPLNVLYEDAHILAVSKPAGRLTQGVASGEPTLEGDVRAYLNPEAPASAYLGTVHRLDRPVSGVVLWAKTAKAARRLSAQFEAHETVKEYWAVIEALREPPAPGSEGAWDDWLLGSTDADGVVRASGADAPGARRALTHFRRGDVGGTTRLPDGCVWLVLRPETGRTHQLRAQAGLRGWPVVGDAAYGSTRGFAPGVALHARSLTFRHPALGRVLTVNAPLPGSWPGQGISLGGAGGLLTPS